MKKRRIGQCVSLELMQEPPVEDLLLVGVEKAHHFDAFHTALGADLNAESGRVSPLVGGTQERIAIYARTGSGHVEQLPRVRALRAGECRKLCLFFPRKGHSLVVHLLR